jgi:hypothetical protein
MNFTSILSNPVWVVAGLSYLGIIVLAVYVLYELKAFKKK